MIKLNILDYLLLITVRIKDFQNYSNVFPLYTLIKIGGPQFRTSAKHHGSILQAKMIFWLVLIRIKG